MPDKHKDNEASPFLGERHRVPQAKLVRTATINGTGAVEPADPGQTDAGRLPLDIRRGLWSPTDVTPVPANANDRTSGSAAPSAQIIFVDSAPFASVAPISPDPMSDGSSRPPPAEPNRVNGAYCLVRDESGRLAPSSSSPPPVHPQDETVPPEHARRWSLVPSPVIALDAPSSSDATRSSPGAIQQTSNRGDVGNRGSSPALAFEQDVSTKHQDRSTGGARPAFDPGWAYPNAPTAQPFVGSYHAPSAAVPRGVLRANAWLFRLGVMICPAVSLGTTWAIAHAWLTPTIWPAVVVGALTGAVSSLVLLHRAWASINDTCARTSARRAILLLLVPLFNVYWIFNVLPGFATDYNRFIARHQISARPLSRNLLLAAMVPLLGLVFYWIAIGAICDAINSISCTSRSKSTGNKES